MTTWNDPLKPVRLDELNARALANRIDAFLAHDRPTAAPPGYEHPQAGSRLLEAKLVLQKTELQQLRILKLYFRWELQRLVCNDFHEQMSSLPCDAIERDTPRFRVRSTALRQGQIVSSRTAFETLMEFVYFTVTDQHIPATKSKKSHFRKWCSNQGNPFGWLVYFMVLAERYDRGYRTAEVHGLSSLALPALAGSPAFGSPLGELRMLNLLNNVGEGIVETLNELEVSSLLVIGEFEVALFRSFRTWQSTNLQELWEEFSQQPLEAAKFSRVA